MFRASIRKRHLRHEGNRMTGLHEPISSERSAEGHRPCGAAARRSLALAIALAATTAAASAMAQPISVMT
jgi:hypothetical protein